MKHFISKLALIIFVTLLFSQNALANSVTDSQVVGVIQVNESGVMYLRPKGLTKWYGSGSSCPDATYVHIGPSAASYDQVLAMAIASKMNNTPMRFFGTCSSNGNYLLITYSFLTE